MKRFYLFGFLMFWFGIGMHAQSWRPVAGHIASSEVVFREPMPEKYMLFRSDASAIKEALKQAGPERGGNAVSLIFPAGDNGHTETFMMKRVAYMEPELARRYPALQTFEGHSKSGKTLYLTVTPYEITGVVRRPSAPTLLVKPYAASTWMAYSIDKQHFTDNGFECEVEAPAFTPEENTAEARPAFNDRTLRIYRYAPSITGEYSQYTLNRLGIPSTAADTTKKNAVLGAVLAAVARINSVYQKDMAMRLVLVGDEDRIIFLDPNNDPFDNSTSSMSTLLSQNQSTVDNQIGTANYDVSQVWCRGNLQGLAQLGVVCDNMKARGAIRGENPETDRYIISVACHEMGHQFGANHVFANTSCGGRRNDNTAVETGSGTTIMAYAGICPPDVQNWTDDRFNYISIKEFRNNVTSGSTGSCPVNSPLSNQTPIINAGADKYIPKETPFVLSASVSDPDGDHVTLVWDEEDKPLSSQNISTPPQSDWQTGPMFRPFPERDTTVRFFPRLDSLLAGHTSTTWEVLPSVTRILKFNVTARDNHDGGGQTANDVIALGVRDDAGPFRVTSQVANESWGHGDQVTVNWDVANTNTGYVNCQSVDILFSPDGGAHFSDTLAAAVPNNGTATFTVPATLSTPHGRLMVKAHDNYFLSLAAGRIMVGDYTEHCDLNVSSQPHITIPDNNATGITDTIHVDENNYITDVNVNVQITHNYVRDLQVILIAPNGRQIVLWDHNCSNQHDLNLTFDDQGNDVDCNNLSGTVKPVQSLTGLNDLYTHGDWVLKINDNAQPDEGTLEQWSIDFCYLQDVPSFRLSDVHIYPNPTAGELNVQFPVQDRASVQWQISDMTGRILYKEEETPAGSMVRKEFHIGQWPAGQYILMINHGKYYFRQIIQKK